MDDQQFANKQLDKQLANDPQALLADQYREERATNILAQINPDNLLTDIEHRIRGEKKDQFGGWTKISETQTPVSEKLISDFISYLGSILNQNTSMSNFSTDEINNLMSLVIDWVQENLVVNAENYGIEGNFPEYNRIAHIVCNSCFTVLKRALNGRESIRIFKMMRMHENITPEKKNKLMDSLNFMK